MKNTPYTVPEGYFENAEKRIFEHAKEIKRHRRVILAICPVAVALALTFISTSKPWQSSTEGTLASSQTYTEDNCDIFLEVFEY